DFFKHVLATIVGIFLFMIVMAIFGVMSLIGIVASGEQTKSVKDNSVLVLNLSGTMEERVENDIMSQLTGQVSGQIGLDQLLSAIKKAKDNDKIKGIYIEAGAFSPDSYASLQAVRNALLDFKKSGKWIVAYGDTYTQGAYYLSSVADKVWLNPQGQVDWHGLAAQKMFVKDLMEKFGVKMQVAKVGSYKSAVEMFTVDKMSDADREQTEAYINGIWQNVTKGVSESRKISVERLNAYADSLITFADQKELIKLKLVDGLLYTDQVKKEVKKLLKIDEDKTINQLTISDMATVKDKKRDGKEIAVYYAYGDIVDGAAQGMSQGHQIDAQVVCKDLEELMNDDDVKAVVLRVNSGGGSAYASEQIWHQMVELKKKKPVVVSMGGMAASGGYYISAPANWIVAEPTTLTGSIGIFGMFPDMSGLLTQKLGLKFDEAKTNKNSAFGTPARPFTAEEMSYLETYIDRGYKLFRKRVADGRKMTSEQVETIAQGHVWLGQDALKIKLVDELGGLDAAITKAAKLAKLDSYHSNAYPAPIDWLDQLMADVQGGTYLDEQLRMTLGEYYDPFMLLRNINKQSAIQARVPYYITLK
ncbi:MAG: signal peptide peptidase SppA, partial [Prevotella sp.]|nr:signal peptide peptidase SppA [Prevotella sp.]